MDNKQQLTTPAVNLPIPADRFAAASKLYGQLHRWRLLLVKHWWVLALVLLVPVTVWWLTFNAPRTYASKARMWLPGKLDIREGRLYTEELIDYLGTQAELLRSPEVQKRALARLNESTNANAAGPEARRVASESEARVKASTNGNAAAPEPGGGAKLVIPFKVKVEEARKSSILELQAVGAEPASTRAFLNYLMEEYLSFKRDARVKISERMTTSMAAQVAQLAGELEAQQEKLHAFQSSNNIVFLQEQGNSAGSYLAMLNRRHANLQTEIKLLRKLLPEQWVQTKAGNQTTTPGETLIDEDTQEMLASLAGPQNELFKANQQMQLLKARRAELSRFLLPSHPKILKLDEDIKTQEKLAQISRDEAVNQMTHRRQAIDLEIKNLEAAFEEWDAKAIRASRKLADYERIRQDFQRIQAAYDKMLGLIQTVDVSRTVEQENVGILEPASAAAPINRMVRNVAFALAGSLLVGFGVLYCFGLFRDDFSSLIEMSDYLSEEVVGQIPAIAIRKSRGKLRLDALEKQRFEFLESFRNIRASLLFRNNGGTKPRTIIITSSVPEEGKSTVALYLAATMALGNSRVLLVDADMRRGTLHECFGAAAGPGLAEILSGETTAAGAIVHPELNNLALLPAGVAKRNPGELVLSSEWSRMLTEVQQQFDYILVDTPPVLATNDALALASKVDGVLFVVRASYTSARMARGALDVLRQCHANVLGLILNRALSSPYEYHSYQRYRQAYGWRPRETRPAGALVGESSPHVNGS